MSRIRCVKPEFWTSEQILTCTRDARLIFIGLWNFCDDAGIHPASYVRLKAEVFPADNCEISDIKRWINELIENQLIREYAVEEKLYWQVTGWKRHQRIDKPTYRHPAPLSSLKAIEDNSANTLIVLTDNSMNQQRHLHESSVTDRNGKEGTGEDGNGKEISSSLREDIASKADSQHPTNKSNCPHEEIIALYHKILPMCAQVKVWNKTRRSYLRQRWVENTKHQDIQWWEKYFEYIEQSHFLTGKTEGRNGQPPFIADLEWLIRPNNFAKIIEGKFNKGQP
ncbi:MAG: hypothetical protein ABI597_08600 [Gammaproteobacteria bacterium]